jgi:hypothetical protein
MDTTRPNARPASAKAQLAVAHLLAQLLQRLDQSAAPVGAEQYRSLVRHLAVEIVALQAHPSLSALLDAYPAAAELYENLNYRHAGLCRSPLDAALAAELQAQQLVRRLRRGGKPAAG